MQHSKLEGSSESRHSPLCPIRVIVQTSDICLQGWGVCAHRLQACWPPSQPGASGSCRNGRGRNSLLGFLWLWISSIFLWPCSWLHLIHLDQFKKIFTSRCHITNVACDLFPFSFFVFPPFPFPFFLFCSFLSVLLAIFTLSSIMVLLHSMVCW